MLTARGVTFFVVTFALLAAAILLGASKLTLLGLTLLLWFLGQWSLFQLRVRLNVRRLALDRSLLTAHGEVRAVWAKQRIDVTVTLSSDGVFALPYGVLTDRLPALARLVSGATSSDGGLSKNEPLSVRYSVQCPAAGRLTFTGVKLQLADLCGFFTYSLFVPDAREVRVLPALAIKAGHATFVKQHNVLPLVGMHRHLRPGGSSELLDLRDYVPGDPPKLIAWKLSARRDRLISKELESEAPIRCTLFLDTSNAVRVGPVGESALCRLVEVAAAVAQANITERDLTGLFLFDEEQVRAWVKPGRGPKHLLKMIGLLTDIAGLIPQSPRIPLRELIPVAYGLAQDLYAHWLDADINHCPAWLPLWSYTWRFSSVHQREYRWRKQLAAIMAIRYDLGPSGLAQLLEDDENCRQCLQRFLAEHQIAYPFPLYDERGRYVFPAPAKVKVLADALLEAVMRGRDNELFVLCVDLLENIGDLAALERAVCVAKAKHHQVIVICPWPAGVDLPGAHPTALTVNMDYRLLLNRVATEQLHRAYAEVKRAFGRIGVNVLCASADESVNWIMQRMRRLRVQERGVR
jgi:uncharacterized protein (DUF58 family)